MVVSPAVGPRISRRRALGGASALAAAAGLGLTSGCARSTAISSNPSELVLWYWARSINPDLLDQAGKNIPSTDKFLRGDKIGGTFDTKLRTSLSGDAFIPDITFVNSNCSLYFLNENLFTDLRQYADDQLLGQYYEWKVKLGTTPTNRLCFWPMDTGPTGFYFRSDILAKAGLPSEPEAVAQATGSWEAFIELGAKVRADAKASTLIKASTLFTQVVNASETRYFDTSDKPLFESEGNTIRKAWDLSVKAIQAKITGNLQTSTDQNAAWVSGACAGHLEAVWWAEILIDTAPDTKGNWRLAAQPERPGNSGGSFIAVPHSSKDPKAGFEFARWLTSPENQAATFNKVQLFPSTPASFESGSMKSDTGFFGNQDPLSFFSKQAEKVPITYVSPYEAQTGAFGDEIANVESAGKDPERAWQDAVDQTNRVLRKRGVL